MWIENAQAAVAARWTDEDFFETYTSKVVQLGAGESEPETDEGGDRGCGTSFAAFGGSVHLRRVFHGLGLVGISIRRLRRL